MKRNPLSLSLLSVALVLALAACDKNAEAPTTPQASVVATQLATATETDFEPTVSLDGEVKNLYSPNVAAELGGRILSVHAEPGQHVKKGDLLVRLDGTDASLSAAADSAEVARLQALATDKQATLQRLTPLAERDLVSRAAITTARQDAAAAAEAVRAAQAKAALSSRHVIKSEIRAPFDAEVVERTGAPGAYVKAGDVVVSLVRPDASYISVTVPESYAQKLQSGMPANVSIAGAEPVGTKVVSVRAKANSTTRAVEAQLAAPAGALLRPGTSAKVELTLSSHQGLAIPETSVITEGEKSFVFIVKDGQAHKTNISLGARLNGKAEVTQGLDNGAQIAQDAAFVYDGAKVAGGAQ